MGRCQTGYFLDEIRSLNPSKMNQHILFFPPFMCKPLLWNHFASLNKIINWPPVKHVKPLRSARRCLFCSWWIGSRRCRSPFPWSTWWGCKDKTSWPTGNGRTCFRKCFLNFLAFQVWDMGRWDGYWSPWVRCPSSEVTSSCRFCAFLMSLVVIY